MNTQNQISMNTLQRFPQMEAVLYPLNDPEQVIRHPRLSRAEKRALLASWASDAYAVENQPTLRRLDNGMLIPVERILSALKALDETPATGEGFSARVLPWRFSSRRGAPWRRRDRFFGPDDDNDPPPCPASAAPRPRAPGGVGAMANVDLACA
ncbi:hypothetical protein [Mesorhizobium sp. ISC11]|uniref:hypothetical protein n=1 Tax=Mesorhizobium sp. ISC11 TaxID=3076428 RepID=UPI00301C530E